MTRIPLILSLLALLPASAIAQSTWYVPDDFPTIQAGIDGSSNGDTVIVRDGTYFENINFNGKAITLKSENGPATTIIDGNQNGVSVVTFSSGELFSSKLKGFALINGSGYRGAGVHCQSSSPTLIRCVIQDNEAGEDGGGMWCDSSNPVLEDCTFRNNRSGSAGGSGGMRCQNSSPTLTDCTFEDNWSHFGGGGMECVNGSSATLNNCTFTNNSSELVGGGMRCDSDSSPTLINCTFTGNSAHEGGGMFCNSSSPNLDNCTFTNNTATYQGGGMACLSSSSPTLENCAFTNNTADWGGGMYCYHASPTLTNCAFTNNAAAGDGGGFYCWNDAPILKNCMFTNNTAARDGGGVHSTMYALLTLENCTFTNNNTARKGGGINCASSGGATLTNCILWDNHASSGSEICEETNTTTVTYSDVKGGWLGTGNIDADPLFVDPANGDFHLQHIAAGQAANSPSIDAGDPNTVPFGNTRTDRVADESIIDMGYHWMDTAPFDGWYVNSSNGHWYRLTDTLGSWDACEAEAVLYEGHLVTIRDSAEADWIEERFFYPYSSGGDDFGPWIGLYQDFNDPGFYEPHGGWKWASGESAVFTDWVFGEPNNWNNEEHWANLIRRVGDTDIGWNDYHPNFIDLPGIIEVPFSPYDTDRDGRDDEDELVDGTDIFDQDTDDDGLGDGEDGYWVGGGPGQSGTWLSYGASFDSDNDGLSDGQEKSVGAIYWDGHGLPGISGTNPSVFVPDFDPSAGTYFDDADTDNDGISDGDEDLNLDGAIGTWETDPNTFDTDSDGLGDGLEIGLTDADVTPDTHMSVFIEDSDPATTTDPLNEDTDGGGLSDGNEDANKDGAFMVTVESDPNNYQDDYFDFAVTNLVAGQHAVLTSTSCKPGGVVYPVYSLSGQGPTSVGLLGFELMLTAPLEVLSPGFVSPNGTAVSTIAIPPNAPSGYNVYWQAVEVFYGVIYRASNPLVTQIQ